MKWELDSDHGQKLSAIRSPQLRNPAIGGPPALGIEPDRASEAECATLDISGRRRPFHVYFVVVLSVPAARRRKRVDLLEIVAAVHQVSAQSTPTRIPLCAVRSAAAAVGLDLR